MLETAETNGCEWNKYCLQLKSNKQARFLVIQIVRSNRAHYVCSRHDLPLILPRLKRICLRVESFWYQNNWLILIPHQFLFQLVLGLFTISGNYTRGDYDQKENWKLGTWSNLLLTMGQTIHKLKAKMTIQFVKTCGQSKSCCRG